MPCVWRFWVILLGNCFISWDVWHSGYLTYRTFALDPKASHSLRDVYLKKYNLLVNFWGLTNKIWRSNNRKYFFLRTKKGDWIGPQFCVCMLLDSRDKSSSTRVDLHTPKMHILQFHTPKMFIMQFHTSNVWKNATHTIFIQFQKIIEKGFELVSAAIWTKKKNIKIVWWWKKTMFLFFWKKWLSYNSHIWKLYD